MKVEIEIIETLTRIETVDACCVEAAIEQVQTQYDAEGIVLDSSDFTIVEIKKK